MTHMAHPHTMVLHGRPSNVKSYMRTRHVTRMPHVRTSHVTHLPHLHTGATRGTHQRHITCANTPRHTYVPDMNHSHHTCTFLIYLQRSDTGHSPVSRHKCERVTSHICLIHTQRYSTGDSLTSRHICDTSRYPYVTCVKDSRH